MSWSFAFWIKVLIFPDIFLESWLLWSELDFWRSHRCGHLGNYVGAACYFHLLGYFSTSLIRDYKSWDFFLLVFHLMMNQARPCFIFSTSLKIGRCCYHTGWHWRNLSKVKSHWYLTGRLLGSPIGKTKKTMTNHFCMFPKKTTWMYGNHVMTRSQSWLLRKDFNLKHVKHLEYVDVRSTYFVSNQFKLSIQTNSLWILLHWTYTIILFLFNSNSQILLSFLLSQVGFTTLCSSVRMV